MSGMYKQTSIKHVDNRKYKPLIKWAGGKTRLNSLLLQAADLALEFLNVKKFNYYEPFFGGGALFFELHSYEKIKNGYINDTIPHLISFYKTVANEELQKEFLLEVKKLTNDFNNANSETKRRKLYGEVSKNSGWVNEFNTLWNNKTPQTNKDKIKSAALFLVLNKSGFNGMFRLNGKGEFNIPMGDKTKIEFNEELFKITSPILKKTNIFNNSYEQILPPHKKINKNNSFIYLDPPYIPNSKTESFTDYSKEGFKEKDHKKLADIFHQLANDGYKVVLSNNSNKESKLKYANSKKVFAYEVMVSRAIAKTNKGKRPPSKELLVSSFSLDSLGLKKVKT